MGDPYIERVSAIVAAARRLPVESIRPETALSDIGIDSLDALDILFKLEEEFDVSLPSEELPRVSSIEELARCARELVEAKHGEVLAPAIKQ